MSGRRAGSAVAATWLIGLGTVFLVREALALSWNQVWPLFVVLVGIAGLVTTTVHQQGQRGGPIRIWRYTWPVAWTVVGIALLASTTGSLVEGPLELIEAAWPWAAIGLGGWFLVGAMLPVASDPVETYECPIGDLTEAELVVHFGAGDLAVRPAVTGNLIDGSFHGGISVRELRPGHLELEQDVSDALPWLDHGADWDLGLAVGIPLDLRFETGACRARLDLADLTVRSLAIKSGASQTTVRLPRAAGATTVRAETGAAEVIFEVPDGVAARIRGRMALGATTVDETRFPRGIDGSYASPDFATATNRVEIDANGGLGAVRVVGPQAVPLAA